MGEAKGEPEGERLAQRERELLTEGQGEGVCVAQGVALPLWVPLPLRVSEAHADPVPR